MTNKNTIKLLFAVGLAVTAFLVGFNIQTANAQYYDYGCSPHARQTCNGNDLYWYDGCGNRQEVSQYCQYGCYNNVCQTYNNGYNDYNNYGIISGSCTYHAYKLCVGNSIYWYSGCNQVQELYSNCQNGLTCQYGQCTNYIQVPPILPPVQPTYNPYYRKACYNNSIYWYDSFGVMSGLYKNCVDANSCTIDSCASGKCDNALKCDGTTCITGSDDYNKYCKLTTTPDITTPTTVLPEDHCGNGKCEPSLGELNANCPKDCPAAPSTETPGQTQNQDGTTAAVSAASPTEPTGFVGFLKRWYIWILSGIVLVALFIIVYKRFSSEN